MTFPVMGAIKRAMILRRARAELGQVQMAIEAYHTKLGYYPPDNVPPQTAWPNTLNWPVNQLYYELLGTTVTNISGSTYFQTLDGSAPHDRLRCALGSVRRQGRRLHELRPVRQGR